VILGIGTDLVVIARMADLLARYGDRFAARVLMPEERAALGRAGNPAAFLAKRFAAKESLAKALGTGFRSPVLLTYMRVEGDPLGRPYFRFAPELEAWLKTRGVARVHLSLSDERGHALAFVIVES
jgi:holo-[acyl-carrier protein] synthase